jgi:hypothetical protein
VFGLDDVVFHALHEHTVVKLDNVSFALLKGHLNDDPVLVAFLHLAVEAVDKRVRLVDFTEELVDVLLPVRVAGLMVHAEHAVYRTHDELIEVPPDQQIRLLRQQHLQHRPNHLRGPIIDPKMRAETVHPEGRNVKHSVEKGAVGFQ